MTNQHNAKLHLLAMADNYAQLAANAERLGQAAAEDGDVELINYWRDVQCECEDKARGLRYRARRLA
jgi:hypothetical protein